MPNVTIKWRKGREGFVTRRRAGYCRLSLSPLFNGFTASEVLAVLVSPQYLSIFIFLTGSAHVVISQAADQHAEVFRLSIAFSTFAGSFADHRSMFGAVTEYIEAIANRTFALVILNEPLVILTRTKLLLVRTEHVRVPTESRLSFMMPVDFDVGARKGQSAA
ncbi:hypothetical protein HO173_000134 [Letharia columbiana]|uniref:Uncharacterized protein n=1 Tax=Letharia columbiana TaxID=112416 RepID=A0A8H6LAE2_9LECA|nr:uncharacterized protein HO173_000134 [Letharia columbiana]KAF6241424.1 hypothetical protein HO173_000134 [Letharia columbiana]